jgi:hypothetical protein
MKNNRLKRGVFYALFVSLVTVNATSIFSQNEMEAKPACFSTPTYYPHNAIQTNGGISCYDDSGMRCGIARACEYSMNYDSDCQWFYCNNNPD